MAFVPNGYFPIREALNRLGRELFPSEWTGEEHKARRGLISEDEWLRIKDLPPARGSGAPGSGAMSQNMNAPAVVKPGLHSSGDPSAPSYQEEYRARQRYVDAQQRLRELLEAGQLEAAILDPFTGALHQATTSLWRRHDADRLIEKGASANTAQSQYGFSPGQAIRRTECGHQADPTGKNPRGDRSPEGKISDGKSDTA